MIGIGFLVNKRQVENIIDIKAISTRVVHMKIIRVYAFTSEYNEDEMENFYENIAIAFDQTPTHFTISCGNLNTTMFHMDECY